MDIFSLQLIQLASYYADRLLTLLVLAKSGVSVQVVERNR